MSDKPRKILQPTAAPTGKHAAMSITLAIGALTVTVIKQVWGVDLPADTALQIAAVITPVVGWFKRDREHPETNLWRLRAMRLEEKIHFMKHPTAESDNAR